MIGNPVKYIECPSSDNNGMLIILSCNIKI